MNKNVFDKFDKIFVIHCVNAVDRYENFIKHFEKLGILDKIEIWKTVSPNFKIEFDKNCFENQNAFLASFQHYSVLLYSKIMGYNKVLICEDDVDFIDDVDKVYRIVGNMPEEYDFCQLYNCEMSWNPNYEKLYNDDQYFTKFPNDHDLWSTMIYSVTKKGIDKLIDMMEKEFITFDHYWIRHFNKYNIDFYTGCKVISNNDKFNSLNKI